MGLSKGAKIDLYKVLSAFTTYETVHVLAKYAILRANAGDALPQNSCTTFAAWDGLTPDGSVIIGRNFDNALNGHYDTHQTLIYFEPNDG